MTFALCCLLAITANVSLVFGQAESSNTASDVAKIKDEVSKRYVKQKRRVTVKMLNGTKLKGEISGRSEDSFELTDAKTKQTGSIAYADVAQVKGAGLSKGGKIGLAIGIGAAATVAVIVLVFVSKYCNNESC